MNVKINYLIISLLSCFSSLFSYAQIDSNYVEEEEDYSMYDNVVDVGMITTYCSPKIFDLSPNRFISVGYDVSGTGVLQTSPEGVYTPAEEINSYESSKVYYSGVRINANIPVVSLSSFVWQMGGGFNQACIQGRNDVELEPGEHRAFAREIAQTLTSINLNTTLFKPVGEKSFLILQLLGELNGNYGFRPSKSKADLETIKTSGTFIYGRRPHDRLQWGVGLSRTYRAGELNYIPVVMYNYTSANRKWGTEILFPAKANYRRKFNSRNILLAGYELEGTSYRLYDTPFQAQNLELRRSDIRFRLDYQRQLKGFLWLGIQAGMAVNYSFNVDDLTATGNNDFFRGFVGSQTYTMRNKLSPMPYVNVTLNLVSL